MRAVQSRFFGTVAIAASLWPFLVAGQAPTSSKVTFNPANFQASSLPSAVLWGYPNQTFGLTMQTTIQVEEVMLFASDKPIASATAASATVTTAPTPAPTTAPAISTTATSTTVTSTTATSTTATSTTATSTTSNPSALHGRTAAIPAKLQAPSSAPDGDLSGGAGNNNYNLRLTQPSPGIGYIVIDSLNITDDHRDELLFFRVKWKDTSSGVSGYDYSRLLVYIKDASEATSLVSKVSATEAAFPESTLPASSAATAASSSASATESGTTNSAASTATGSTAAGIPAQTGDSGGTASTHGKKKGLGGGAIAGIVIGVLVGLAIVGAAVFYYRRRAHPAGRLSSSAELFRGMGSEQIGLQSGFASAAAVEKDSNMNRSESRFGSGTTAGAHSPYSDDDGAAGIGMVSGTRAGPATPAGPSPMVSTTRPADLPTPMPPALAAAAAAAAPKPASVGASAAAAPPPAAVPKIAVSDRVAALIEEHMTSDDVARLEAEERELDMAIENAERSRQAAPSGRP